MNQLVVYTLAMAVDISQANSPHKHWLVAPSPGEKLRTFLPSYQAGATAGLTTGSGQLDAQMQEGLRHHLCYEACCFQLTSAVGSFQRKVVDETAIFDA